ncbi:MAG: hypothetical protein WCK89_05220 [bacterium]
MQIKQLGIPNKQAIIILGAGASRGAKCFEDKLNPAPLDADFFSIMQRVCHYEPELKQFLDFVRSEFGAGSSPGMEEVFTQLEALARFSIDLKIARGRTVTRYVIQLKKFVGTIATFFRHTFCDSSGTPLKCDYHETLAEALNVGDTVISFNYDCIIDAALHAKKNKQSWSASNGYHAKVASGAAAWDGLGARGRRARHPIKLLKLHGSLNWDRATIANELSLRADPYETLSRSDNEIVPPVWNKTIGGDMVFSAIWKEARRMLPKGKIMIVAGYSVPPTDLLTRALIRVSASEREKSEKLSHLLVVNPSVEARAKLIDLVRPALDEKSAVIELTSMRKLAELLS